MVPQKLAALHSPLVVSSPSLKGEDDFQLMDDETLQYPLVN